VRCGVGPTFFPASVEPIPTDPHFVCIGRLSAEKGQLVLLEAVARLRDEGVKCTVTLIGDGPLRDVLESFVDRNALEGLVHFTGWKSSNEVRAEILLSRALVMPSFAEGLPVSILEALALGRPVIATYVGGIPELVEPGKSGWLVPAGSVEVLARAIREAMERPAEDLGRMAHAGSHRMRAEHDLGRQVEGLQGLMAKATIVDQPSFRR
jgi:glycosyltransferase involved in cell wall biosynthesis